MLKCVPEWMLKWVPEYLLEWVPEWENSEIIKIKFELNFRIS